MTATVRVSTPEEIAAMAGGTTPRLHWPARGAVFAERAMRLRQLAQGHAMGDFLQFMAELALLQQAELNRLAGLPVPDDAAVARAAGRGVPPLAAVDWPRDPAWRTVLRSLCSALAPRAPAPARDTLQRLAAADDDFIERQADALLTGVMHGLDLATAPLVAAALQVTWTHLLLALEPGTGTPREALGFLDDRGACPACGSRPVASLTRSIGGAQGQRYLHCGLCNLQWHLPRATCSHCGSTARIAYQSLDAADSSGEDSAARAARAPLQAETCEDCGHYLKIVHSERDPFVEPVADDLASVTLDLLVSQTGLQRHGVNLMLLYGEPDAPDPAPSGRQDPATSGRPDPAPPDPAGP